MGAHCLRGHEVSRAYCLWGMLSPGADFLQCRLSPGRIVSGAWCLWGRLSWGILSPGHIVSGPDCLGSHCLGAPCPQPVKTLKMKKIRCYTSSKFALQWQIWVEWVDGYKVPAEKVKRGQTSYLVQTLILPMSVLVDHINFCISYILVEMYLIYISDIYLHM